MADHVQPGRTTYARVIEASFTHTIDGSFLALDWRGTLSQILVDNTADSAIDEILTLNTLPAVLNRDEQGRLRRKMVVLKIEKWLASALCGIIGLPVKKDESLYQIDMSSKNQRFTRKIWTIDQLQELRASREAD